MNYDIFDIHGHNGEWHTLPDCNSVLLQIVEKENLKKLLISNLKGMETEGHVAGGVPLAGELEANRETVQLCRDHDGVIYGAAVCQVGKSNPSTVEQALSEYDFKALKFHPYLLGIDADDGLYDPYLEIAEHWDLPCVFHSAPGTSDPIKIYTLAKRHPRVKVVLYHINLTGDCEFGIELIKNSIRKKDAQLYCDTSWVPLDMVIKALNTLGAEHVMFGSDLPLDGVNHFKYYRGIMETVREVFSSKICDLYFYRTAEALFLS